MKVFVTGATGFIGSAIVQELLGAGHQVLGVVRSDESANALAATGAEVHRGSIYDLDSLQRGAAAADGVIHTAFNHDFSKFKENCETDRQVIEAIGTTLQGSNRPFVITSGTALLSPGRTATEKDAPDFETAQNPRVATDKAAALVASRGVNVSLLRLPPSVHGKGDHGFVPILINLAKEKRISVYIGEGQNRWPAVHRLDAAVLYRLALEKGATNSRYHAVGEEGVTFKDIAETISGHLNLPVRSISPEEVPGHFGWFAHFAMLNSPASSAQTREALGWKAEQPGLLADMAAHYF